VDVVVPFDEPTPEASLLGARGGQAVLLPSLEGCSAMQSMKGGRPT
jgi:hypothetical protein